MDTVVFKFPCFLLPVSSSYFQLGKTDILFLLILITVRCLAIMELLPQIHRIQITNRNLVYRYNLCLVRKPQMMAHLTLEAYKHNL